MAEIEKITPENEQHWINQNKKKVSCVIETRARKSANFLPPQLTAVTKRLKIGNPEEITTNERAHLKNTTQVILCPGAKDRFRYLGLISMQNGKVTRKWKRLEPHLPNLENKIIADIGCSNGLLHVFA